ncbi:MAG: hypothetical protein R3F39_21905 [Myxococcota bacterium]
MGSDSLEIARERLRAAVVADGFDAATVELREEAGPLGLQVLTAQARDAYPGTGFRAVVVDGAGVAYGKSAALGLADLARARGWLTAPPSAADLVRVANAAAFDGLLALTTDAPTLKKTDDGALELRFVRTAFPSGAREPMLLRIGSMGREEVQRLPAEGPGPPTPIDATTGFVRALDAGGAAEIALALSKVRPPFGPREFAAFARAAVIPNEDIATTALVTMGGSAEALAAVGEALAGAPDRREAVVGWVGELYGSAAAAGL